MVSRNCPILRIHRGGASQVQKTWTSNTRVPKRSQRCLRTQPTENVSVKKRDLEPQAFYDTKIDPVLTSLIGARYYYTVGWRRQDHGTAMTCCECSMLARLNSDSASHTPWAYSESTLCWLILTGNWTRSRISGEVGLWTCLWGRYLD